jgi:arylsulfatase A-like enzyme
MLSPQQAMGFLWLLVSTLGFALASPAAERPNIVFILADDLGYTDLACYGSRYYETPNIDRLAREGMRFTAGYTCGPNCQPTRAALLTGQYGPRTGVYTVGSEDRFDWPSRPLRPVENVTDLPLEKTTVANALQEAGYATAMFGKWHLGKSAKYHPSRRGFDEAIVSQGRHFNFQTDPPVPRDPHAYLADFLTDQAVRFIRKHQNEPFFLYLPHFGVHNPYEAKEPLIDHFRDKPPAGGHRDPVYAAMIASVDESVGRILELLDELNLADKTLVILSSDNGGVGGYQRLGIQAHDTTDNSPLRGGKGMLYEGGIRVPYIFRQPGFVPSGSVCEAPINSVDLFPTLLEIARAKPPSEPLDGVSYVSLLKGEADGLAERAIYWHFPGYLGAGKNTWRTLPVSVVRQGDWKLLEFHEDGRLELYNLRDDVGEEHNLAEKMPDRAAALRRQLESWRKQIGAKMPRPNADRRPPRTGKNRQVEDA